MPLAISARASWIAAMKVLSSPADGPARAARAWVPPPGNRTTPGRRARRAPPGTGCRSRQPGRDRRECLIHTFQPTPDHAPFESADRIEGGAFRNQTVTGHAEGQALTLDSRRHVRFKPWHPDRDRTFADRAQ